MIENILCVILIAVLLGVSFFLAFIVIFKSEEDEK